MPLTLDGFARSLSDCGLMEAAAVQAFIDGLPPTNRPTSAEELAKEMYRAGRLTKFQTQTVYQGKAKGLVIGNYVLLDRLGQGGMGQVYVAKHRRMDRVVALKMLPAAATKSKESVQRFQREVHAAARLTHRNIVTAHDADEHQGVHFLIMEHVDGQDLQVLVKQQGPFSVRDAVDCIMQAAEGLAYAHDKGVIHRDIKPANLLRDKSGTIKILDLGLARIEHAADASADGALTQTGQVMGTIDYMSPEQSLNTRTAGVPADIYSLGCTLHYLLTGQATYVADTLVQRILAHREHPIPSLRALRSDVPAPLDLVFRKMIAKRPEERQTSMREVIAALRNCEGTEGAATPTSVETAAVGDTFGPMQSALVDTTASQASVPFEEIFAHEPAQLTRRLTESTRRWLPRQFGARHKILIGVAVGVVLCGLLLGIILRLRTSEGTLVVEIDEPDAIVQIFNDEGKLTIERNAAKGTLTIGIDPGKHRLRVEKNGFQVFAQDFVIGDGGKEVIRAKLAAVPSSVKSAPEASAAAQRFESQSAASTVPQPSSPPPWPQPAEPQQPVLVGPDAPPLAIAPFDAAKAQEHQAGWAKYLGVPLEMTNSIGMKLRLIPSGEFQMGSPEHEAGRQQNQYQHRVRLTKAYYLGVYEVTQSEYERVMGTNPSCFCASGNEKDKVSSLDTNQFPVDNISWDAALMFVQKLSSQPVERAAGRVYRLPTEAEWEYACRAGTVTPFHVGAQLNGSEANCDGSKPYGTEVKGPCLQRTTGVGSYKPNGFGLYDMHGNICEWCQDWFDEDYYRSSPTDDPQGVPTASDRVYRGGSWYSIAGYCRAAYRFMYEPSNRYFDLGFRVALAPPGRSSRSTAKPGAEAEAAQGGAPPTQAAAKGGASP